MSTRVQLWERIDPRLLDLARQKAPEYGLNTRQLIELALAEYLHIPPAIEGHTATLGLCPNCERAIIVDGRCERCNWRENTTRARQHTRVREPRPHRYKTSPK